MIERTVNVGDRVEAGQLLGRLEALNELNALGAAKANFAAAQAKANQVRNHFERQQTLLAQGWTTRANFDQAERELRTAEAQVDAREAQLEAAHDLVEFYGAQGRCRRRRHGGRRGARRSRAGGTDDREARAPGRTRRRFRCSRPSAARGARPTLYQCPLTDDPTVTATGRVREVSPQADPVTRTFQVKVGLTDPPDAMRLGATVTGTLETDAVPMIEIPSSALTEFNRQPCSLDRRSASASTVDIRNVDVLRFDPATVTIAQGLDTGDVVVTAGVQALRPGQKVRMLGSSS